MKILSVLAFALTAASVVPVVAPFALEAVAQQPYYQSAGKNLSANLKVDALGGRMVTLSETITQIITCNDQGKLFDGTGCVAPGGASLNISCGAGEVLKGISNGNPVCVADATGGGGGVSVPSCSPGQVVAVSGGNLVCMNLPTAISASVPPVCDSSLGVPFWDGAAWVCKKLSVRVASNGAGSGNKTAECDTTEVRVGGGTSCGNMPNTLQSAYPVGDRGFFSDCEPGSVKYSYAICASLVAP